ncbi:hypothetical protein [Mycobacteroides abscessus]|uniref:hypothetical protein n=1 Tax=Mycobacteroides abscessus TaxID=36809 RepID=UPI0012FFEF9F|nr:hypothetical protein [Mycobacteroides abscessus]
MTPDDLFPIAFAVLLMLSAAVVLVTFSYLAYFRFKQMLREKFSLSSVVNLSGLMDFNLEALLVPTVCLVVLWPLLTYLVQGRIGTTSLPYLLIDVMFLLGVSLSLRTIPRVKRISTGVFSIAIAVYCIIFIIAQVGAEYYLDDENPHRPVSNGQAEHVVVSQNPSDIATEFGANSDPDAQKASGLAPRSCVNLSAEAGQKLQPVPCGSGQSVYRVVQIAPKITECISDVDKAVSSHSAPYALCLDYDWSGDHCLQITSTTAQTSDCAVTGAERFQKVLLGAVDDHECEHGGFIHEVRKFTVCTHTQ